MSVSGVIPELRAVGPNTQTVPAPRIFIAVPVYDNAATVRSAVTGALAYGLPVVVVDDGSSDKPLARLGDLGVTVLRHENNRGKGAALVTAACWIQERGGTHMVCFDADGQFDPLDIAAFIEAINRNPKAVVYGIRRFDGSGAPRASMFGRSFSNFWARLTTGGAVADSQCGFRAYPVACLLALGIRAQRFDFEVEALVRSAWAGLDLVGVPVFVTYEPPGGRVTHFHLVLDNLRITRSYTRLVMRGMIPLPHRAVRILPDGRAVLERLRPRQVLAGMVAERSSPWRLAAAVATGLFLATLPLIGFHSVAIVFVATALGLNRVVAFSVSHLCAPPVVPAVCLEVGSLVWRGHFLSEFNAETLWHQAGDRIVEYLVGTLVVAPVLALIGGAVTLAVCLTVLRLRSRPVH